MPLQTGRSRCRSCEAPIAWARVDRTGNGASLMPLDPDPAVGGNVQITGTDSSARGKVYVGLVLAGQARDAHKLRGGALYLSHFVTCPNAPAHRRRLRTGASA